MHIVITGAGGFLGRTLCRSLLQAWPEPQHRFTLIDSFFAAPPADARTRVVTLDLEVSDAHQPALDEADVVLHLAALPGGAAERDYDGSRRGNLDVSMRLMERLAARSRPARFVYASSVAVFGAPLPARIDDETVPRPSMTYGAHKLMVETALADFARRRRVDGIALRLSGLLCRPPAAAGMRSAFMSEIFHAAMARRPFTVPVSAQATVWIMAAGTAAAALVHAAEIDLAGWRGPRALTLPAMRVSVAELIGEVCRQCAADPRLFEFQADPALESEFGRLPPLATPAANALGFAADPSLAALVRRALEDAGYLTPGRA